LDDLAEESGVMVAIKLCFDQAPRLSGQSHSQARVDQ
jgi:hypothetical protein